MNWDVFIIAKSANNVAIPFSSSVIFEEGERRGDLNEGRRGCCAEIATLSLP